ncbi:zinc ribbon domain-containing protein [Ruminococcaceae bacterium OttesenSCG-928-I18]|nr:zinc ribbon domain-containing protein [Ruminococcaceae bacterium OttesenSCG-928-I18]
MKQELDRIMDVAGRVADKAARATSTVVERGKDKMELYTLQQKLSKAQKQLGALVYMLHKTGQENQPMVEHYINEIDELKAQIEFLQPTETVAVQVHECPSCGAEGMGDAMFCRRCGAKLSE